MPATSHQPTAPNGPTGQLSSLKELADLLAPPVTSPFKAEDEAGSE